MSDDERAGLVSEGLAEIHARRARGGQPRLDEIRRKTGEEAWADLRDVLAAEAALDAVIEPALASPSPRKFGKSKLPPGLDGARSRAPKGGRRRA